MIDLERDTDHWRITLNRPDKANALTRAMLNDIAAITEDAQDKAKVLSLHGAGKVFSAGADLADAKAGLATDPVWERLSGAIAAFPGLTIAALNGTCAGGAMGMVLACDLRICVPTAKFFYPVMALGFLPQPSDPCRLVRLCGLSRAKMILLSGQKIPADQALSWGLVDRIVALEDQNAEIDRLSADLLAAQPNHTHAIKALINQT
ncbi:enoyl-CoA hydratase/isomerase family protein [Litoreibacter roseus]|uniref:Enoyl-CoA hydratase n=1 Tax=Litoreibacter roseus TaxID=2601869 RepID=A0A6N6JIR8_9RHOB|nr:enoyl-CoA hydratase/isomerase family protein [Litoreibacter roseus]GFE66253.1 enoyl-CoA hydratase [Litoreibacter roseus]